MASILRISDSKTIQLINEWEKFECLWNTKLINYPDKASRAEAVGIIAQRLDIPNFMGWHVVTKFKNLRNSYRQELKKMALDCTYKPKVIWFSHMDKFLRPHLQKIPIRNELPQKFKTVEATTDGVTTDRNDDMLEWSHDNSTHSEASFSETIKVENPSEDEENSNESNIKRQKLSEEYTKSIEQTQKDSISNYLDEIETEDYNGVIKTNKSDHYDAFGAYVASLLKMLPPQRALMMQPKIVNFLISAGVEELNQS